MVGTSHGLWIVGYSQTFLFAWKQNCSQLLFYGRHMLWPIWSIYAMNCVKLHELSIFISANGRMCTTSIARKDMFNSIQNVIRKGVLSVLLGVANHCIRWICHLFLMAGIKKKRKYSYKENSCKWKCNWTFDPCIRMHPCAHRLNVHKTRKLAIFHLPHST